MTDLSEILDSVRGKIAAACARVGRDPSQVEIIAVTKTHGAEVVKEAWNAGLAIVGENKVQEAAWKKPASVSGRSPATTSPRSAKPSWSTKSQKAAFFVV